MLNLSSYPFSLCLFFCLLISSAANAQLPDYHGPDTVVSRIMRDIHAHYSDKEEDIDFMLEAGGELDRRNQVLYQQVMEEILRLTKKTNYSFGSACVYNSMAIVSKKEGHVEQAIDYYFKSIDYLDKDDQEMYDMGRGVILRNIALVYKQMEDYRNARKYLLQAMDLSKKTKDTFNIIQCYDSYGSVTLAIKDTAEAERLFRKGIDLSYKYGNEALTGEILFNSSTLYDKITEFDILYERLIESLRWFGVSKDPTGEANVHIELGRTYMARKEWGKAYAEFIKGLEHAAEIASNELYLDTYELLHECLFHLGRFKEAYQYQRMSDSLGRQMMKEENLRHIAEMDALYQTSEKEKQLEIAKRDAVIKDHELDEANRMLYWVLSSAVLILFLIILWILRFREKKRAVEREAKLQAEKYEGELALLRSRISSNLETREKEQMAFSLDGNAINERLNTPLTERELEIFEKLSAGMTNKEIGESLFISVNTVKTHLMSIYSKLDVSNRTQATKKLLNIMAPDHGEEE